MWVDHPRCACTTCTACTACTAASLTEAAPAAMLFSFVFAGRLVFLTWGKKTPRQALELSKTCGVTRPAAAAQQQPSFVPTLPATGSKFHVDPLAGDDDLHDGSAASPYRSVLKALAASRGPHAVAPKSIVLNAGVHYLNETITLGASDSGLTISAAPGAAGKVTVSGGVVLNPTWTKSTRGNPAAGIYVTDVPTTIKEIRGLQTLDPHGRVTRAREPNADPAEGAELCTKCWHNGVKNWHRDLSCVGSGVSGSTVWRLAREGAPRERAWGRFEVRMLACCRTGVGHPAHGQSRHIF